MGEANKKSSHDNADVAVTRVSQEGTIADTTVEESRRKTAEFLGLSEDEISYIDQESLDRGAVLVVGDADAGDLCQEQQARIVAATAQPVIVNAG